MLDVWSYSFFWLFMMECSLEACGMNLILYDLWSWFDFKETKPNHFTWDKMDLTATQSTSSCKPEHDFRDRSKSALSRPWLSSYLSIKRKSKQTLEVGDRSRACRTNFPIRSRSQASVSSQSGFKYRIKTLQQCRFRCWKTAQDAEFFRVRDIVQQPSCKKSCLTWSSALRWIT